MNLHVTYDSYGLFPCEIARRIKNSADNGDNIIVNLTKSSELTNDSITYINTCISSFKKYIQKLDFIDKVIFHPYTFTSYHFLKLLLKKFPGIKVYWVCWSYEIYGLTHITKNLLGPFSTHYLKNSSSIFQKNKKATLLFAKWFFNLFGASFYSFKKLQSSYQHVHFFCSMLPSDYEALKLIVPNHNIKYLPFAYLSLEKIMPGLNFFHAKGGKIMVGHSASPNGNHYEVLQKISTLHGNFSIFLPLVYGDLEYGNLIKQYAIEKFSDIEILEEKLPPLEYYKKLTDVSWAIINAKAQQGLGNILALVWMGVKLFLDKNTSTYKDFISWGIIVFNANQDLNERELSTKLTPDEVENNKRIIFTRFNEEMVEGYWKEILS